MSAGKIKTKTIDGVEFSVAPFMAVEALRLKAHIIKTFGPALGQMLGTLKGGFPKSGKLQDIQLDGSTMAGAIQTLMEQLDEESFINLLKRLFANLIAKGSGFARQFDERNFENSMNDVFQCRLFSVYPVIALVLEANYPDFFGKTVRNIGGLIRETAFSGPESANATEESES